MNTYKYKQKSTNWLKIKKHTCNGTIDLGVEVRGGVVCWFGLERDGDWGERWDRAEVVKCRHLSVSKLMMMIFS